MEQLSIFNEQCSVAGCGDCVCETCLYWWSDRCPYGSCYDDLRAKENPYNQAHPTEPPRTAWAEWNKPGEQAHWCRGGTFYRQYVCEHYVLYTESTVRTCLASNIEVFQDGFIHCSIIDTVGCEACYKRLEEREE